jgi:O-antigen/teichoic acid export membrane protein
VTALLGGGAVLLGAAVVAACLAYLTGALVGLAVSVVAVRRSGLGALPGPSCQRSGRLATQSVTIGLSGIFNAVLFRIDASMLALLTSTAAVGLYGAAYRLLETTLTLSFAFVAALMPLLARVGGYDRPALNFAFSLGCKVLIIVLFPIGLCFVLFAVPMVDLLYGPQFSASASGPAAAGRDGCALRPDYLCSYVLLATDRQRLIPWVTGIGAAVNIALNAVAIPMYSLDGAAAVTTLTQIGLTVVMVALVVRETGRIATGPVVGGALAGCLALAAVAMALGPTWPALAGGAVLYILIVAAWERWRHPEDVRAARLALGGAHP